MYSHPMSNSRMILPYAGIESDRVKLKRSFLPCHCKEDRLVVRQAGVL